MPFDAGASQTACLTSEIKPFPSADRAWLWAASCLAARRAGKAPAPHPGAPCRPETILSCLDRLYRTGRIDYVHARVLRRWGDRGRPPPRARHADRSDWRQWQDAMIELDHILREKGIVAGFDLGPLAEAEKIFARPRTTVLSFSQYAQSSPSKEP